MEVIQILVQGGSSAVIAFIAWKLVESSITHQKTLATLLDNHLRHLQERQELTNKILSELHAQMQLLTQSFAGHLKDFDELKEDLKES